MPAESERKTFGLEVPRILTEDEKKEHRRSATRKWFAKKELDPEWVDSRRADKRAAYAANPEPYKARTALARTPEKQKRNFLRYKYGITLEDFEAMLIAQDERCAICLCAIDAPQEGEKRWNYRCVDHDHATNKVRAILCRRCNVVLGQVGDSVELLEAFITYLRRHREAVA